MTRNDERAAIALVALAHEQESDPEIPAFYAPRPCNGCGFVRRVQIHQVRKPERTSDVDRYGNPRMIYKNAGESYERHCTACQLEANARKYDRLADLNRKRAAVARSKQAIRRLKNPTRSHTP